jgi:threonine synthase
LIYEIASCDDKKNASLMKALTEEGKYEITPEMKAKLSDFYGNFATEAETGAEIKRLYEDTGYVLDTHTAVASAVYGKYKKETGDDKVCVIASTASPFKFTRSVMEAIGASDVNKSDLELTEDLSKIANVEIPNAIEEIKSAPVRHTTVCEVGEMEATVKKFLNI